MRELLTSGAVGSIEVNIQKKIREDINKRWESLGLIEGLNGHIKETVSTLFENQAKHLIVEASSADNSGSFETVVFPLIRRVFSKLLANDIVSVQAMNLPIGKLFFIRPTVSEQTWYKKDGTPVTKDDNLEDGFYKQHTGLMGYKRVNRHWNGQDFDANERATHSVTNRYHLPDEVVKPVADKDGGKPEVTQYFTKSLYDLFYNDFLFDQSKGRTTIRFGKAEVVVLGENGQYEEAKMDKIPPFGPNNSVMSLILKVTGFSNFNAGRLTGPDGNEMDTEEFLASLKVLSKKAIDGGEDFTSIKENESISFRLISQKYGRGIVDYGSKFNKNFCNEQGELFLELDLSKPAKKVGTSMTGYIGISTEAAAAINPKEDFLVAWAQYDSLEFETEIGEVSFELSSVTVSAQERKLRATWSPELAQDVSAFHNIDAEAELTAILSEQVAAEIDREILRDLRKGAAWHARWDYNGWRRMSTTSTNYTQKDWNQTLMTTINQLSAQIHKSTLRGGANFVVVSSEISAVLNDLEYFHVTDASAESEQYSMGIEKLGSLQGRYKVIVDPYAPHWSAILGHQGSSLLDTGYIYAPYVPMALTPVIYNPHNFAPVKGISTRYAKKMVNNRFYASIKVDGLPHFDVKELR